MMCASLFQLSGAVQLSFLSVAGHRSTTDSDCFLDRTHTAATLSIPAKVFRSFRAGREQKKNKKGKSILEKKIK